MLKCTRAECGITKTKFVTLRETNQPVSRASITSSIADTGLDPLIHKGIPWLADKSVEMARYYGCEALRNPKLPKKAIDYTLSKATPFIQKSESDMLDQLSTKFRPNSKYKTDRKDLDGGAIDVQNLLNQKWLPEFHMRTWKGKKIGRASCRERV